MADQVREAVVLGALLHDIGKFWQRADKQINYSKSEILDSEAFNSHTEDSFVSRILWRWK